jgi:hypothetical protein
LFNQRHILIEPLTAPVFAPYGDVLDATGDFRLINEGLCQRHHDRARLDFSDGQAGVSIFKAQARSLPYALTLPETRVTPQGMLRVFGWYDNEWGFSNRMLDVAMRMAGERFSRL